MRQEEELKIYVNKYSDISLAPHNSFRTTTDKAPSEATFRGTEFLSYDLGQTGGEPIVSAQDAISLYFRTRQPNGLLFFTGEHHDILISNRKKSSNSKQKKRRTKLGETFPWID